MFRPIDSKAATTAVEWSAATAGALALAMVLMLNAAAAAATTSNDRQSVSHLISADRLLMSGDRQSVGHPTAC